MTQVFSYTLTDDQLLEAAREADHDQPHRVDIHDDLYYEFSVEYDDRGTIEHVNECDCYGKLAWPETSRYDRTERRPRDFTGAARKFGATPMHDTIWWEPYRDGKTVYDDPETVRFMRELLDWGFVGLTVNVMRRESCGHFHEAGNASLWGIESAFVHKNFNDGYSYYAEVFSDLIYEATYQLREDD